MRISKTPEVRKQEILDQSIRLFLEKGYEKTSISDIAKSIGISQGLCYRYYTSKEEIYDAALDQYADFLIQGSLRRLSTNQTSLLELIQKMSGDVTIYSSIEKQKPELYELFHHAGNRSMHDQLYLRVAAKLIPYIVAILEGAQSRGEIHVTDLECTASFIIYGQIGFLQRSDLSQEEKQSRIKQTMIELLGLSKNTPE